jgi:hypothetical protein
VTTLTGTGTQVLEPKFDQLINATSPLVDAQGNIYFQAQPTSAARIRIFRSDTKGNLHSWDWRSMQLRFSEVSPDGHLWAVISRAAYPGDLNGIHMLDLASGKWEEVVVPIAANLINP